MTEAIRGFPEEIKNPSDLMILLICGSTRVPSYTRTNLQEIEGLLQQKKVTTNFWDLRDKQLPLADPAYHMDPHKNPDERVQELAQLADRADAFILGTPLYHNSYSGVIKNALDNLTISQFEGKPVGLVAHGSERTVVQACDHLRIVVRGLSGIAIPQQIATIKSDFKEEKGDYQLVNDDIKHRMLLMVQSLAIFAIQLPPLK
jgi:azobenzene reductase